MFTNKGKKLLDHVVNYCNKRQKEHNREQIYKNYGIKIDTDLVQAIKPQKYEIEPEYENIIIEEFPDNEWKVILDGVKKRGYYSWKANHGEKILYLNKKK